MKNVQYSIFNKWGPLKESVFNLTKIYHIENTTADIISAFHRWLDLEYSNLASKT